MCMHHFQQHMYQDHFHRLFSQEHVKQQMQCGELQLLGSSFYFQQAAESSMRGNKDPDPKLLLPFSEDQQL